MSGWEMALPGLFVGVVNFAAMLFYDWKDGTL